MGVLKNQEKKILPSKNLSGECFSTSLASMEVDLKWDFRGKHEKNYCTTATLNQTK